MRLQKYFNSLQLACKKHAKILLWQNFGANLTAAVEENYIHSLLLHAFVLQIASFLLYILSFQVCFHPAFE